LFWFCSGVGARCACTFPRTSSSGKYLPLKRGQAQVVLAGNIHQRMLLQPGDGLAHLINSFVGGLGLDPGVAPEPDNGRAGVRVGAGLYFLYQVTVILDGVYRHCCSPP